MIIETSAVVAIVDGEPTAERLRLAIVSDRVRLISAVSVLEAACVLTRRHGAHLPGTLDEFLAEFGVEKRSFDDQQLHAAQIAWLKYGRGFQTAGLNFGDCAAYALSRTTGEPLLYVGDDFSKTDIAAVAY